MLTMSGYQWLTAANNVALALLNVGLCVALTPIMPVFGLAVAGPVATAGVNIVRALQCIWLLRMTPYTRRAAKPMLAAAVATPLLFISFDSWVLDLIVPGLYSVLSTLLQRGSPAWSRMTR